MFFHSESQNKNQNHKRNKAYINIVNFKKEWLYGQRKNGF